MINVVIVDDHPVIREGVKRIIESVGEKHHVTPSLTDDPELRWWFPVRLPIGMS